MFTCKAHPPHAGSPNWQLLLVAAFIASVEAIASIPQLVLATLNDDVKLAFTHEKNIDTNVSNKLHYNVACLSYSRIKVFMKSIKTTHVETPSTTSYFMSLPSHTKCFFIPSLYS